MKNADMPAMPQTITDSNDGSGLVGSHMETEWQGLTKREMFAMKAMQGILSGNSLESLGKLAVENGLEDAADALKAMSYMTADKMLGDD